VGGISSTEVCDPADEERAVVAASVCGVRQAMFADSEVWHVTQRTLARTARGNKRRKLESPIWMQG
jgi:hypothetical protein